MLDVLNILLFVSDERFKIVEHCLRVAEEAVLCKEVKKSERLSDLVILCDIVVLNRLIILDLVYDLFDDNVALELLFLEHTFQVVELTGCQRNIQLLRLIP